MLRMSKMTDYGALVLATMASTPAVTHAAAEIAESTGIRLPTTRKLLKMLARGGLVSSKRGSQGGYILARKPIEISAVDMIEAIEGPLAMTECSLAPGLCELEPSCPVSAQWQKLSGAVRRVLAEITLADLVNETPVPQFSVERRDARHPFPLPLEAAHGNA
jgi:FeS assembly SUF system regulator